ncbi:MAG: Acylphosphatase [Candidatus Heimdallarchaeota archaeon LC_2]|nr:MAG: Acylphosphatase [Candidatus Heimdallarchaeota archaeon LC_2]
MSEEKRVKLVIFGIVQGVFYRTSAIKEAKMLTIVGWIKNRSDSSVECIAEGTRSNLEKFISWCKNGPPHAKVERIDVEWLEPTNEFTNFEIKYY